MSIPLHPTPPAEPVPAWEAFLERHFKTLLIICAAAVLAMLTYGAIRYAAHQKAVAAGAEFAAAKTVDDYDIVMQKYPGTVAAGNALLLKADLLWEQNKKDSSIAALREFADQHPKHPLLAHGLLGLASKLEALGERVEAKSVFERLVTEFATSDLAPLAQLRLGDLLWAEGKEDDAKTAYETVAVNFPDAGNAFTTQSETRANWIIAKLPTMEVEGPPKPEEPAPTAPQIQLNAPGLLSPTITPQSQPGAATSAPFVVPPPAPTPDMPQSAPAVPATAPPPAPSEPAPTPREPAPAPATSEDPAPAQTPPAALNSGTPETATPAAGTTSDK